MRAATRFGSSSGVRASRTSTAPSGCHAQVLRPAKENFLSYSIVMSVSAAATRPPRGDTIAITPSAATAAAVRIRPFTRHLYHFSLQSAPGRHRGHGPALVERRQDQQVGFEREAPPALGRQHLVRV